MLSSGQEAAPFLSGHDLVYVRYALRVIAPLRRMFKFSDVANIDSDVFLNSLQSLNWEMFSNCYDANIKLNIFNDYILQTLNEHAPLRTVVTHKNPASWLNHGIRLEIRERNRLHKIFLRSHLPSIFKQYKTLRNQVQSSLRRTVLRILQIDLPHLISLRKCGVSCGAWVNCALVPWCYRLLT